MRKYSVQVYKTGHEMPDNENPPASVPKGGRAGLAHHQAEALRRRGCQPVTALQDNEVACGSRTAVGMLIRRQTSEEGEPQPVINGLTVQCTRRLNIEESPEQPE